MLEPRANSGVSTTAFYAFAAGVGGVALIAGAFFVLRWHRKRAAARLSAENQARQLRLQHASPPTAPPFQRLALNPLRNGPLPPAYTPTHRDRIREQVPPPRDRLSRLNSSVPRLNTNVQDAALRTQLDNLATSNPQASTNTLAPPPNPFNIDEGSAQSDASEFDLERRGPAVNAPWAAHREEHFQKLAEEGYTMSDMMLASDTTEDAEEGTAEGVEDRGSARQPIYGSQAVEGIDGFRMQRLGDRPKWALPDRPKEPMPSAVGISKPLPAQTRPIGQSNRSQEPGVDDPRVRLQQQTSIRQQQPRSHPNLQEQVQNRPPASPTHPPSSLQPRPRAQFAQHLTPEYNAEGIAESVDSSHLSQADLAPPSSVETELDDARLSRDPWLEEVRANRRRGGGRGRGR
ncbi:MAG: hypothetical protein M1812_008243 [Candelaria pacifica]|nr:MAG: hypothetical protein M1812_008243 [Candelaria pacifica]